MTDPSKLSGLAGFTNLSPQAFRDRFEPAASLWGREPGKRRSKNAEDTNARKVTNQTN